MYLPLTTLLIIVVIAFMAGMLVAFVMMLNAITKMKGK